MNNNKIKIFKTTGSKNGLGGTSARPVIGTLTLFVCLTNLCFSQQITTQLDPTNLLIDKLGKTQKEIKNPKKLSESQTKPQPSSVEDRTGMIAVNYYDNNFDLPFLSIWNQNNKKKQNQNTLETPDEPENTPSELTSDILESDDTLNEIERQLWKDRISLKQEEKQNPKKSELQQIIEKIEAIELEPQYRDAAPILIVESVDTNTMDESPAPTREQDGSKETKKKNKALEMLSHTTLKIIDAMSEKTEKVENPFEIAEILFQSGYHKKALVYYQQALGKIKTQDQDPTQKRAWILYQLANCFRTFDLQKAAQIHRQLITEHPESLWAELAKTQSKLVEWYRNEDPAKLVETEMSKK